MAAAAAAAAAAAGVVRGDLTKHLQPLEHASRMRTHRCFL
jgi:hypothetical protein